MGVVIYSFQTIYKVSWHQIKYKVDMLFHQHSKVPNSKTSGTLPSSYSYNSLRCGLVNLFISFIVMAKCFGYRWWEFYHSYLVSVLGFYGQHLTRDNLLLFKGCLWSHGNLISLCSQTFGYHLMLAEAMKLLGNDSVNWGRSGSKNLITLILHRRILCQY